MLLSNNTEVKGNSVLGTYLMFNASKVIRESESEQEFSCFRRNRTSIQGTLKTTCRQYFLQFNIKLH